MCVWLTIYLLLRRGFAHWSTMSNPVFDASVMPILLVEPEFYYKSESRQARRRVIGSEVVFVSLVHSLGERGTVFPTDCCGIPKQRV